MPFNTYSKYINIAFASVMIYNFAWSVSAISTFKDEIEVFHILHCTRNSFECISSATSKGKSEARTGQIPEIQPFQH